MRLLRRFARSTRGASVLEGAIIMPLAISLMAGAVDFGRGFSTLATAQKSMRNAGRYLSMLPPAAVCGWGQTRAKNLAVYGNLAGSGQPLVYGWTTGNVTLVRPTTCTASFTVIELSASVPYTSLMLPVIGLPGTLTMTARHEERWIGQ
jgi:hypothetical protein